jgi:hypothetical protein
MDNYTIEFLFPLLDNGHFFWYNTLVVWRKRMAENWFEVDKKGLGQLQSRKRKSFLVFELVQNAWDQNISRVDVELTPLPNRAACRLVVTDDDPEGFADLTHAYTLFAPSMKKRNPEQRGRFNLGEKLVMSCCEEAKVISTTGGVLFPKGAPRRRIAEKTTCGSRVEAVVQMTRTEFEEVCRDVQLLIPPESVIFTFNGTRLNSRAPLKEITVSLPTEVEDDNGNLRRTIRKTKVRIYEPLAGEVPSLYEMGIIVVETGDKWHVNILQKVPLNSDRDNVTPAFLQQVRVLVLNAMHAELTEADAGAKWVKAASDDARVEEAALSTVLHQQFGDKLVSYDPSDTGANNRAVAAGFTVLHGRNLTATQWEKVRDFGLVKPAGKVTPDKPHFSGIADTIPSDKYTPLMVRFTRYARFLARQFCRVDLSVVWLDAGGLGATYCRSNTTLTLYRDSMPDRWLAADNVVAHDKLLIHELGHHEADGHLTEEYYEALCDLGARAIEFALAHTDEMKKARE